MQQDSDKKEKLARPEGAPATPTSKASQPSVDKQPPKSKASAKARPDLEREVASRLSFLRQAAREVGHNYVVNLEHDLIKLSEAVHGIFDGRSGPDKKELGRLGKILEIADGVKLKPAKGRRKDLKRIEQAVAEMQKLLIKKK